MTILKRVKRNRNNNTQLLFHYHDDDNFIEIKQQGFSRWLHTGSDCLQSAIDTRHPENLVLSYQMPLVGVRAFLPPHLDNMLLLGLGGGSLARTFEELYPNAKLSVIDIEPMMIDIARDYFFYEPKANTELVVDDAYEFLKKCPKYDLIIIDLYNLTSLPPIMLNPSFYRAVQNALTERGTAAFNLVCDSQEQFMVLMTWIRHAFQTRTVFQGIGGSRNVVIYAFNHTNWETKLNQLIRHKLFYNPAQTQLLGFYIEHIAHDFNKKLSKLPQID